MRKYNTDMADERVDEYKIINNLSDVDGIKVSQEEYEEFKITEVDVLNKSGEDAIGKKIGKYITFDMENIKYIEDIQKIVDKLKDKISGFLNTKEPVLVVGLGNRDITADALGSRVASRIEVTRHILNLEKGLLNKDTRKVSSFCPSVMGSTGIKTDEIVTSISKIVKPKYIIVIDSLMSKSLKRVGSSIQLSNTGIIPGSGIMSKNDAIDEASTGATVISIGVPMVVDIATIANEALDNIYPNKEIEYQRYDKIAQELDSMNYIVTPKDIDELIQIMSEIICESINKSLQNVY